jgi:RNA polymerase sigma factor (sigma-70 family)
VKIKSQEEHIRHRFDSFCKKVLRNEVRNIQQENTRKLGKEISFSELSEQELGQLSVTDDYPSDSFHFDVAGYTVAVESEAVAEAIAALPGDKRSVILLSYFLGMTDGQIGDKLNLIRSTVQYKRTSSLRELKKIMEGKKHE